VAGACHGVELPIAKVEALGLGAVQGTGAAAAEDGKMVAGLVDGAVTVNAFRNR